MNETDNSKELIDLFISLCSGHTDLGHILLAVQNYDIISIDNLLLNQVISIIDHDARKNVFWDALLPHLSSDSFNDDSLAYFYQNKLGIMAMCHKPLPDEWLLKYSIFDDEPLYILTDRYCNNDYSNRQFVQFIETYILSRPKLYEYVLEYFTYGEKWKIAIILGTRCSDFAIKKAANDHLECLFISNTHNTEKIVEAYEKHRADSQFLISIAENPATPCYILHELAKVSGIKYAHKIRKLSTEMLALCKTSSLLRNTND